MQNIAKELNLSESTFVLPPKNKKNHFQVRIFTPAVELPMAGHPTIGTAFVLAWISLIRRSNPETKIHFEEGVGRIEVALSWKAQRPSVIWMKQPNPIFGSTFTDVGAIAEMLSIKKAAIQDTKLPLESVSCGVPFLMVPVRRLEDLRLIKFRRDLWQKGLQKYEAPHVFVFTTETETKGTATHCRMFAPALGVEEDPATGGASGPLGCYLVRHKILSPNSKGNTEFISEQGFEMGRPSFIQVRIHQQGHKINSVHVGGQCRLMGSGQLFLE